MSKDQIEHRTLQIANDLRYTTKSMKQIAAEFKCPYSLIVSVKNALQKQGFTRPAKTQRLIDTDVLLALQRSPTKARFQQEVLFRPKRKTKKDEEEEPKKRGRPRKKTDRVNSQVAKEGGDPVREPARSTASVVFVDPEESENEADDEEVEETVEEKESETKPQTDDGKVKCPDCNKPYKDLRSHACVKYKKDPMDKCDKCKIFFKNGIIKAEHDKCKTV